MEGLVISGSNNFFDVETADGNKYCSLKGKKIKGSEGFYNPLAPGDRVVIEPDSCDAARGQILSLVERRNMFSRWNTKGRALQLLAANVDYLVCVTTPAEPPFRPRFVDRLLVQAEYMHLEPLIVVNKCDLPFDIDVESRIAEWERLEYKVCTVSAQTGQGLDVFARLLAGKVAVFAGQSGVGKSSLINALSSAVQLRTGELCRKFDRGSHTTTKGVLLHLETAAGSCSVIDTPGIRQLVLHGIEPRDLLLYFPEMAPLAGTCTFGASCSHEKEPGCKIMEAVYAGVIHEDRYDSWLRIKNELAGGTF